MNVYIILGREDASSEGILISYDKTHLYIFLYKNIYFFIFPIYFNFAGMKSIHEYNTVYHEQEMLQVPAGRELSCLLCACMCLISFYLLCLLNLS